MVSWPLSYLAEPFMMHTESYPEGELFVSMLHEVSKKYSVRDLVEKYSLYGIFPVKADWVVPEWKVEKI